MFSVNLKRNRSSDSASPFPILLSTVETWPRKPNPPGDGKKPLVYVFVVSLKPDYQNLMRKR